MSRPDLYGPVLHNLSALGMLSVIWKIGSNSVCSVAEPCVGLNISGPS